MDLDERLRRAGQLLDDSARDAPSQHARADIRQRAGTGRKAVAAVAVAAAVLMALATTAVLGDRDDVVVASQDADGTTVPTALPADLTVEAAVQRVLPGYVATERRPGGDESLTNYGFVNGDGAELEVRIYRVGGFNEHEMGQLDELPTTSNGSTAWLGADDIDLRSVYLLSDGTDVGVRVSSGSSDTRQLLAVDDLVDVAEQLVGLPAVMRAAQGELPQSPTDQTPGDMPPMPTGGEPSQSAQDAARDGVHPGIASLPDSERSERLSSMRASGAYWVLSRTPVGAATEVGDPDGRYGIDRIVLPEYGEILLVNEAGRIDKAYPMPGLVPSWIHVTDTYVYAGRVGDGALSSSSIVRIDRTDLSAQVIVFPVDGLLPDPALGWEVAPADMPIDRLVTVGPPGDTTSWIGPVDVDLVRIDELFDLR